MITKMNVESKKKITARWLYSWGYSASSCAEACGVSRTHITNCLKGRANMSRELRERVLALPRRKALRGRWMKGVDWS